MSEDKRCLRCGHVWEARVAKPKQCPKCKTYSWATLRGLTRWEMAEIKEIIAKEQKEEATKAF